MAFFSPISYSKDHFIRSQLYYHDQIQNGLNLRNIKIVGYCGFCTPIIKSKYQKSIPRTLADKCIFIK